MDGPLILYLQGFTSGPQSRKVQVLAARMAMARCRCANHLDDILVFAGLSASL